MPFNILFSLNKQPLPKKDTSIKAAYTHFSFLLIFSSRMSEKKEPTNKIKQQAFKRKTSGKS